jgi:polysaccharide export outer membrane protein
MLFAAAFLLGRPAVARDYVITSGDVLGVKVVGEADYSKAYTVTDEGKIFVPNIGDIVVTGKTANEVRDDLTTRLKTLLKNPVVTVEITSPTNTTVWVTGEVNSPGEIKVKPDSRLMDVIQKAGGIKDTGDRERATLLRRGEATPQTVNLDALYRGDLTKNELVQIGDTLYIPKKAEGKIKILGEVSTPGEKDLKQSLTPMEAVTLAGGFKDTADKSRVMIQHRDGTQVTVDLEAEARGEDSPLTKNLYLQEDDVILVPNNKNNQVIVSGPGAKSPGSFGYEPGMKVMDAVTKAGGFTDTAVTKSIHIVRENSGPMEVNMEKFFKAGDTAQNVSLQAGDIVVVDQKAKKEGGGKGGLLSTVTSIIPLFTLFYYLRN